MTLFVLLVMIYQQWYCSKATARDNKHLPS